jgi:DNA-binding response OmpR family regulator
MARILVVEDCPDSRALIERSLADHELRLADSVSAAELALGAARFELVLLDLGLPDGDGFQICQRLQQGRETRDLPVVFLTASSELRDKVLAFQLGADDYVVKPFHPAELRVRVEARLRRARREAANEVVEVGELRLDPERFRVERADGAELDLTPRELRLLHLLARRSEQVVTRAQILECLWGGITVSARTVDTHVCNLRRKLGNSHVVIEGVRGLGYRLRASSVRTVENS